MVIRQNKPDSIGYAGKEAGTYIHFGHLVMWWWSVPRQTS